MPPPDSMPGDGLGIPADYGVRRGLPLHAEAPELVCIGASLDGGDILLSPRTAAAWARMRDAARASGIALVVHSGFRSAERQAQIIRGKLADGETIDAVLRIVAAPGFSEHHTGSAIDVGVPGEPPLSEDFARTPAFLWLLAHGQQFGFRLSYPRGNSHGIAFEPWHWCHREPKSGTL